MRPPLRYRHTQFATAIVVPLLLVAVLAAGVGVLTGVTSIAVIGPALMAVFLALFYALTVEIDATHLTLSLRDRARSASASHWPRSWRPNPCAIPGLYGWGIHRTPHGGLYNVSGWEAVEIPLASGQRFRLGTDEPRQAGVGAASGP